MENIIETPSYKEMTEKMVKLTQQALEQKRILLDGYIQLSNLLRDPDCSNFRYIVNVIVTETLEKHNKI